MMKLMLIPESIAMAKDAVAGGVDRIFIDLERAGKFERQGGGTWISTHTLDDVSAYREALPDIELLVRIDPWCAGSPDTVEQVVARGADIIMLPMIENVANVEQLCDLLAGRASAVPLIETVHSAEAIRSICQSPVTEIYVGLNDLHRQLGLRFMFEPLASGLVDQLCSTALKNSKPFGFGGMAQIGHGDLPAEMILGEHVRMGSSAVILSRKFKGDAGDDFDWSGHIARIRELESGYALRSAAEAERDRLAVNERIRSIAATMKAAS
jgi:hypothetical protein